MPIASTFEPSDAIWDGKRQKVWMVSDEGKLANMNFDGSDVRYWNVQNSDDLEGLVQIEGRDEYIYLQQENTKMLLEFHVRSGQVVRSLPLGGLGGFEAIAWVQSSHPSKSVLYSGNQPEGKISVNSLDFVSGATYFVETFALPAPNPGDLSALHYEIDVQAKEEHLTALFDAAKLMVLYTRPLGEFSNLKWRATKQWNMPDVGSEGIAFAQVGPTRYFFVCIDTSKGTVPKVRSVFRYNAGFDDECFGGTSIL